MMGYGAGLGLGFGFGGLLTVLGCMLLVVGLVVLAVWAMGRSGRTQPTAPAVPASAPTAQPDAVEVLRMRLARGEISLDDYTAAKQALEAGR